MVSIARSSGVLVFNPHPIIGVNPGAGAVATQILGWGSWGLHEILLYPIMYWDMR